MKNMQSLIGKTIVKIKMIQYLDIITLFYTSDNEIFCQTILCDRDNAGDWIFEKLTVDDLKSWDDQEWYIRALERGSVKVYE